MPYCLMALLPSRSTFLFPLSSPSSKSKISVLPRGGQEEISTIQPPSSLHIEPRGGDPCSGRFCTHRQRRRRTRCRYRSLTTTRLLRKWGDHQCESRRRRRWIVMHLYLVRSCLVLNMLVLLLPNNYHYLYMVLHLYNYNLYQDLLHNRYRRLLYLLVLHNFLLRRLRRRCCC